MNFPTPAQLDQWANTLAATDWHGLTHGINVAITREVRGGNSTPDGYPVSTRGGMGGGAELTPTEAAAAARIAGTRDEHHELTRHAIRCLDDILYATGMMITLLAKLEARSAPVVDIDERWCRSCRRDAGYLEPVSSPRYAHYCRFCGDFNGTQRMEPPLDLLRARHDGRRITTGMVDHAMKRGRA